MCLQGIPQNNCWIYHKSGSNKTPRREVRLSSQRKRKKKQRGFKNLTQSKNKRTSYDAIGSDLESVYNFKLSPPRMILIALSVVVLPLIVTFFPPQHSTLVDCQLILNHPRNRAHRAASERSPLLLSATLAPYSIPFETGLDRDHEELGGNQLVRPLLHPWKLREFYASENIANYSTLPTNQDKQNELLRKLSSTMLLETLIRHPFPARSPFPPLPWPSSTNDRRSTDDIKFPSIRDSIRPSKLKKFNVKNAQSSDSRGTEESKQNRLALMDVSTTNRSVISTRSEVNDLMQEQAPPIAQDLFNSSSLNYLVDKLLSVKPFRQDTLPQPKRPAIRQKSHYHSSNTTFDGVELRKEIHQPKINSTNTDMTLDMLIKDEYDSRVKPMFKSLLDQQRLSSTTSLKDEIPIVDTITNGGPVNHKIDELASGIDATTSNFGSLDTNQTIRSLAVGSNINVPTTTPMSSETVATIDPDDNNTLVSFEDNEDSEDGEDDEDEALQGERVLDLGKILFPKGGSKLTGPVTIRPEIKKTLQNVPPYQLSGAFDMHPVRTRPPKLNIPQVDHQATTMRPMTTTADPRMRTTTARSVSKFGEKTADASIRGSLVFSDGATEAERANRRRAQARRTSVRPNIELDASILNSRRKNQDSAPVTISDTTLQNQEDKHGESFLLSQLFSTINPLADLDYKLKEQLNKKSPPININNNPLIYKGYVGRDDHLISTTVKDWSRPIVGTRENAPTTMYRFQDTIIPSTTPAPPTEPPSVPYNYFLNPPVTNAQSVPTMVIPTSDPPEITTHLPIPATDNDRRNVALQHSMKNRFSQQNQQLTQQLGNTIQNITLLPMNTTTSRNIDRKFSYQIPDKQAAVNHTSRTSPQMMSESELGGKSRNESTSSSKSPKDFDQNWSPTKVVQSEGTKPFQKRRQHSHSVDNQSSSINSQNPVLVPIVGPNSPTAASNRSQTKVLPDSDSETGGLTTTTPKPRQSTVLAESDSHEMDSSAQKNSSHGDHRSNPNKRNRVKILSSDSGERGLMGDVDSDHWTSSSENSGVAKKKNHKLAYNTTTHKKPSRPDEAESDNDYDESDNDSEESDEQEVQPKPKVKKHFRDRIRDHVISGDDEKKNTRQNKTSKKGSYGENHELAGSEILVTGLDKNLRFPDPRRRNQSFSNSRQPTRVVETIIVDGNEGSSSPSTPSSGSGSSFGSTIIPNSNYFGDAPSESSIIDNPSATINSGNFNGKNGKHHTFASEDPYQRSSNTVLSTVQQPSSTTSTPNLPSTTVAKQPDDGGSSSVGTMQQPTKPISKTSNDRLAFILIGGSCALSVVCLVLAAMSMRCQDMCDDYRSLRNAERAALKLQKHRLKYTKNHQINRLNHTGRNSPGEVGHSLIDDLNTQNNSSIESEINQMRNSKCLNTKPVQLNDAFAKNSDGEQNVWTSTKCQLPIHGYINKESVNCRCGNCINQRWLYQDDMLAGGKQQPWLQPYYYLQNHSRARPLFGVGSSVGTFFPRRMDEHNFLATGGPGDAQILIDNQPSHSCVIGDQRGVTRSKSILHTNKKSRLPDGMDTPCDMGNFNCNNPEHSHHVCHNHHKCNMETSASEESKMTLDESIHCDSAKCSANHHSSGGLNHRLKLMQMRSNGHNHQSTVWKPESIRKSSKNYHHHHHHHSQAQMSSSDGSLTAQCTCSRDHQPLLTKANTRQQHRTSHKHSSFKRESRQQQAKRDKAMLIWSTNRDRLI